MTEFQGFFVYTDHKGRNWEFHNGSTNFSSASIHTSYEYLYTLWTFIHAIYVVFGIQLTTINTTPGSVDIWKKSQFLFQEY